MAKPSLNNTTPFWVDESNMYLFSLQMEKHQSKIILRLMYFYRLLILIGTFSIIGLFIFLSTKELLSWTVAIVAALVYAIFIALLISYSIVRLRNSAKNMAHARDIQQQAQQLTGASTIGSMIHLAGHPLLSRDQPVVLALANDSLSIYDYTSPVPLDTLSPVDLLSVHTVVYDDDRIPHLEVIDSAAQAIQLEFTRYGKTWTCLFQHMQKLRPIDWYHAIQQAIFSQSSKD